MRVIKSEWHQVEKRYAIDIDENTINEIYSDATVEEIEEVVRQLNEGELDVSTIIEDAYTNNVDLDWDWLDEDDWWTDRKGGYDVTYEAEGTIEESVSTNEDLLKALQELKDEFDRLMVEEDEPVKPKRKTKKEK
jgi:hypothetical protein